MAPPATPLLLRAQTLALQRDGLAKDTDALALECRVQITCDGAPALDASGVDGSAWAPLSGELVTCDGRAHRRPPRAHRVVQPVRGSVSRAPANAGGLVGQEGAAPRIDHASWSIYLRYMLRSGCGVRPDRQGR